MNRDYITVECDLDHLRKLVEDLEREVHVEIIQPPAVCLSLVNAQDSVEHQPFYLGEVLCTESEVLIDGNVGYGICAGDEPQRSYCLAVIDSLLSYQNNYHEPIQSFLQKEEVAIRQAEKEEYNQIMRTRVDFKLMEEA